jgi:copper transport protein
VLLVALTASLLLLAAPGRASAHPTLLYTTPAAQTADPVAPDSLALLFGEPVAVGPGAVTLLSAQGQPVQLGPVSTAKDGRAVTAPITALLPVGVYTVRWQVTGADGDLVEGQFRFAVGAAITGAATEANPSGTAWSTVALRWLLFLALAVALGGVVAQRIVRDGRAVNPRLAPVRSWAFFAIVGGLAATLGLAALQAAQIAGWAGVWRADAGRLLVTEALGFAVAAGLTMWRAAERWAALPLLGVTVAEGIRAHPNVAAPGWGAALTIAHLTAAAVWLGALLTVVRAAWAWRTQPGAPTWVLSTYARLAAWLFAVVVTTGAVEALLLVPPTAVLSTSYGRLLLVKLALVAVAAALALTARRLLRRAPVTAAWTARAEAGVLSVVLAVTAVLVSAPPPGAADDQLPGPPPPAGVVLPLGTLAGQIGVGVEASAGRLVVHLAAPNLGDYYATTPTTQTFALTGRLQTAAVDRPSDVVFRGCGGGCFLADVAWAAGDNLLTLRATAKGWHGGAVTLLVPSAAQPAAQQLAAVVTAMSAVDQLMIYEAVTSDTSTTMPEPTELTLTARDFLPGEPYSSGVAPQVVALPPTIAGQTTLALGFPAEARYVQLTLDARSRIIEEVITDPKHLTRRRFIYPADAE